MRLRILTPDKTVLDAEIQGVFVKAIDGELGVLPGHIPLLTALDIGIASYINTEGAKEFVSIVGGTFKVENDEVTILTEQAELGDDIDEARATRAVDRAKAEIQGLIESNIDKDSAEFERARLSLLKAIARINAANKNKNR